MCFTIWINVVLTWKKWKEVNEKDCPESREVVGTSLVEQILKILNFYFDAGKDCLHSYADSSKNHPAYQDNSVHMGKIVEKITPPTEIPSAHRWDLGNRGNIFSHMNAIINKQTFLRTPRSHWIRRLLFIPSTGTKISHMNRP